MILIVVVVKLVVVAEIGSVLVIAQVVINAEPICAVVITFDIEVYICTCY